MLTVNELASAAAVPAHVVRYYARIGLIAPARHRENGYRLFSRREVERVRFIRMAKRLGFTLNEIRHILAQAASGQLPCDDVRQMLAAHIEENRRKIAELEALQRRMESANALWQWMPEPLVEEGAICPLIESVASGQDGVAVSAPQEIGHVPC